MVEELKVFEEYEATAAIAAQQAWSSLSIDWIEFDTYYHNNGCQHAKRRRIRSTVYWLSSVNVSGEEYDNTIEFFSKAVTCK